MTSELCMSCFRIKGKYQVCRYCGFVEGGNPEIAYHLKPGTVLRDRYIIGRAIGNGGFGITYYAYDVKLGIVVVVKEFYPVGKLNRVPGEKTVGIIPNDGGTSYNEMKHRFLEEARNMALFEYETDIVSVYAFFEENDTAYIIMEYVQHEVMRSFLKRNGAIPQQDAVDFTIAILNAVEKLHDKGIIHQDIAPDNLFRISPGKVILFDFGAARLQDDGSGEWENKPMSDGVVKPGYTPPEQYAISGQKDQRVDIYAVGAVMYQMLTGEKPVESMLRRGKDPIRWPSELGFEVDEHIENCLKKAMAFKASERYANCREFREDLLRKPEPEKKKKRRWW